MAKTPATTTKPGLLGRLTLGPKLMAAGVALFVLTRIIVFLPLGFVGSWINGFLWPILLLTFIAGAVITYRKSKK